LLELRTSDFSYQGAPRTSMIALNASSRLSRPNFSAWRLRRSVSAEAGLDSHADLGLLQVGQRLLRMPKYMKPEIIHYINSRMGQDRCLWGTNGALEGESGSVARDRTKRSHQEKLFRDNAVELFGLSQ
jgi:hypothetical protein